MYHFFPKIHYSVLLELYTYNFCLFYICGCLRLCNWISNCGKGLNNLLINPYSIHCSIADQSILYSVCNCGL